MTRLYTLFVEEAAVPLGATREVYCGIKGLPVAIYVPAIYIVVLNLISFGEKSIGSRV